MTPRLTVVIPTIGRPTLAATLASIAAQAFPPHEVLLVGDGPQPEARRIWEASGLPGHYWETLPTHHWGCEQRNAAIEAATGEWITFQDDDDTYSPAAFDLIALTLPRDRAPTIYRMCYPDGHCLWDAPVLRSGNIGSQMIVVPRDPRLARWTERYEGDFDFINATVAAFGGAVSWREDVIALVQPHREHFESSREVVEWGNSS